MTLNLAHRSSEVIYFDTNRKRIYIFLLVVIYSNLDPILGRFRDTAAEMSKINNFPTPLLFRLKFGFTYPLEYE